MKSSPSSIKDRQTKATLFLTTYLLLTTTTKDNLSFVVTATPFHHPRPQQRQHRHLRLPACFAAAGGGGFGTNKKTSTSPNNKKRPSNSNTHTRKNTKKSKSKTGSPFFDEILSSSQPSPSSTDTTTQTLDRFGLPPPTIDDVFPPLSPDVSRVPVHSKRHPYDFDKDEVAEAMKNHLGVDLDIFDDRGYSIHVECDDDDKHDKDEIQKWKLNLLHKDPPVFTIENFFTPRECEMYKSLVLEEEDRFAFGDGNAKTRDSAVKVTSPTFAASSISKRTSTTWFCRYETVPTLLAKVQRLLGDGGGNNGGGVGLERMEEPQIVRYRTGEEFSWHYDEIPSSQLSNGGQRQATLLVYLNDLDEDQGGGTVFRDLTPPIPYDRDDADDNETRPPNKKRSKSKRNTNDTHTNQSPQLTVRPKTGMALLFFPSYRDGTPDIRTLHKGEVALSQKMIAQVWVHEREYRAGVPEGNRQEDAVEGVERERERLGFC